MDVERTIEFILDQQAKFWAGLQEMKQQQAGLQHDHAELRSLVQRLAEEQLGLAQTLNQFQQETRAALLALAEAQRQTAEAQRRGDERLNALIAVVDGIVRREAKP
jgi:septal ring factor EnvC (AmiA/AmiB activator)